MHITIILITNVLRYGAHLIAQDISTIDKAKIKHNVNTEWHIHKYIKCLINYAKRDILYIIVKRVK